MTRTLSRISKTGYVSQWPADKNIGIAEAWFACFENGIAAHYDTPLDTAECQAMVEAETLRYMQGVALTGQVVYQLVQELQL